MSAVVPALIVLAKAPVPGRVKTRLCPPCTPRDAAALAAAALSDTLLAAAATPAARHVLVLDGEIGRGIPSQFDVVPQVGGGLGARLAAAFAAVGAPALLIGMDTPQITPALLVAALDRLGRADTDAVLGLADDGGYWAVGLGVPCPTVFAGVPMSTARTGIAQLESLRRHGLRVALLPHLRDVDLYDDAAAVAAAAPSTRFAARFSIVDRRYVRA